VSALEADSALVDETRQAPNHDERRDGRAPDILLLHYTGMVSAEAALERLAAAESGVSCHYVVDEDGRIVQMVAEGRRAWHAGVSSWEGETDVNSRSVGVEIVNPGHEFGYRDFPDAQVGAVIALCRDICARRDVQPERVLAHSDVAPRRKQDPGERFPWARLAAGGVGHWTPPTPIDAGRGLAEGDEGEPVEHLQTLLSLYGYGLEIDGRFDAATAAVVRAFQRHFRPAQVDGVADFSTCDTLRNLLAALQAR
jgi:N-acetylmuramoyl-L-alanine amidase